MSYQVDWSKRATRDLGALPRDTQARLIGAAARLKFDPRPSGCKKLKGRRGLYRVREGSFRVLYTVDDSVRVVIVAAVGDRKDVY